MLSQADREALIATAQHLTGEGKGILAADESTGTVGKRLGKEGLENTEVKEKKFRKSCLFSCSESFQRVSSSFPVQETRRNYRELFITADIGKNISGIILYKETLAQATARGTPFVQCLHSGNILPGIKVDEVNMKLTSQLCAAAF